MISSIDRLFNDMDVTSSRPFMPNPVLQIKLGRVLRAVVAFKVCLCLFFEYIYLNFLYILGLND